MAGMELLASGYGLIEGPRMDPEGNLYFSDVHNGGVYRRRPSGEIETVIPKRRGVGGIAPHTAGGVVVSGRNVQHVREGVTRVLLEMEDVGGFNDLQPDAAGRIYVGTMRTDPFSGATERVAGECWRIDAEGKATQLYDDISLSNGIGFSPGGGTIYHVDTARRHVVAHDIIGDQTTNRRVFVTLERGRPDGMAVDQEGGLWIAAYEGGCVAHYDRTGALVEYIDVPANGVTSLCFGGPDLRDLYVVTADNAVDASLKGSIFRTRASVPGLPTPLATV
ncbi:MAG: SMP-30/gluconolactonase/LRE family protein [Chloroflexi bacterium]|nr:SMP-30/gluconolactonase/LRE family protein [Chloroflexota bacterium]